MTAAKKTTYTCPAVAGSKRTSHRPYTHAVVGRYDCLKARTQAANKAWKDADADSYAYAKRQGAADEWAAGVLAQFPTVEAYVAHQRALRVQRINEEHGYGAVGRDLVVLQWSMSAANAAKGCGQWSHTWTELRVVECVPADAVPA